MLSLKSAELAIALITFFLAYLIVVTFAGYFSAWVAKKMGDYTGADAGLLTLNPFAHIDVIGLLCLFFMGIGWDKNVPTDPTQIYGTTPWMRWIKIAAAYWARSFAHFVIGTIAMTFLFIHYGLGTMALILESMAMRPLSPERFALLFPDHSSLAISVGMVFICIVHVSVLFAVFDFLLKTFSMIMYYLTERSEGLAQYNNFFTTFLYLLIIMIFIVPQFWWLVLSGMSMWGRALAAWFGGI